jgi:hypothetical protein
MFLRVAEDTVAPGLSTGRMRGNLAMRMQLPSVRLVIPWRWADIEVLEARAWRLL